jgi:DegV family protein with EDD domain
VGVRIVTDSACDLPEDVAAALHIEVVPLTIRFGKEEFVDREELDNATFWKKLRASEILPETAAPSAGAFETRYRKLIDRGATGIICINLSSKLSGTMQAAQVAASAVSGDCVVQVVDSETCSMGLGALCLTAARRAADGDSIESIVREVISRRDRTQLFGALDTLEYLKKGGRVGTRAGAGNGEPGRRGSFRDDHRQVQEARIALYPAVYPGGADPGDRGNRGFRNGFHSGHI